MLDWIIPLAVTALVGYVAYITLRAYYEVKHELEALRKRWDEEDPQ